MGGVKYPLELFAKDIKYLFCSSVGWLGISLSPFVLHS